MNYIQSAFASLLTSSLLVAGAGKWRLGPEMPRPRAGCQVASLQGRILVAGGSR
ncbi:MAG: hypothetical protein NTY38_16215 [Acidobacteria bacterium]|nr:hypothetical protein [Acidobacteriota bacterium]